MERLTLALLVLTCLCSLCLADERTITCGSVIKLQHKDSGNHLHSHAIAWGSGSGQQSVTTTGAQNEQGKKEL
jgi:dolichyl-phosphate-mannose--protein O-mannosyl transferase